MPKFSRLTKIVATLGPATESDEKINSMVEAGVDIFRFNTKHNTLDWHLERIEKVRNTGKSRFGTVGVMLDLQGPEIRIGTPQDKSFSMKEGDKAILTANRDRNFKSTKKTGKNAIIVSEPKLLAGMDKGDNFSIEDGLHPFEVVSKVKDGVMEIKALSDVTIQSNKSLNLVGKENTLPTLGEKDLNIIKNLQDTDIDFIALSFVRSGQDIDFLREVLGNHSVRTKIIAKIENQSGLDNINEIISDADGIMIARGDLGIETPPEKIPYYQKVIINKCRDASKPVIVATQMLQSMIERRTPSRAEIADIANAVYDRADALLLSEETAVGKYPVEAVKIMDRTTSFNEMQDFLGVEHLPDSLDQTYAVVKSALSMLEPFSGVNISKLIVGTETGYTARVFSSHRPKIPILALSDKISTVRELSLSYGVIPVMVAMEEESFFSPDILMDLLKKKALLKDGETVLFVHGRRLNDPGNTNSLSVLTLS